MMAIWAQEAEGRAVLFEDFFRGEYAAVYRAAYFNTGSHEAAQDVTQEAFARAYARWWRLKNQTWAGGWVMTTAMNLCKKHHRLAKAQPHLEREGSVSPPNSETALDLSTALRTLPLRQRTALVLFYLADLSLPDIARAMQISEGTVKAHLAQARSAMRRLMEEADD